MTRPTWTPPRVIAAYAGLFALLFGSVGYPMFAGCYVLVALVVLAYEARPRTDETERQPDTAVTTRRWLSMDKALTDERGVCWICQQDSAVLELLDVGSRYELACVSCADALKKSWRERAA